MPSENDSRKSGSRSTSELFPGSSLLTNLMPLPGLAAPRFPSFSELVGATVSEKPTKRSGLFLDMLGDPQVLYQDLLEDPSKYEEGVSRLLQELISGQQQLSELNDQEMGLLDRAVLDFNQPARKLEARPAPAPKPPAKAKRPEPREKPPKAIGAPSGVDPYWWVQ